MSKIGVHLEKSSLCVLCHYPLATFPPRSSFSRRIPWCLFGWRSVVIAQTLLSKRCLSWVCARLATIRPHKHTGEFKTFDTCLSCSQAYMILPVCLCGRLILKRIVCLLRSKPCLCTAASITSTQQGNRPPLFDSTLHTRKHGFGLGWLGSAEINLDFIITWLLLLVSKHRLIEIIKKKTRTTAQRSTTGCVCGCDLLGSLNQRMIWI